MMQRNKNMGEMVHRGIVDYRKEAAGGEKRHYGGKICRETD